MKPGAYTLEIRTSMGHYIRTEQYSTFSRLLEAVKRQPATRERGDDGAILLHRSF